jgi:hypothetical protein
MSQEQLTPEQAFQTLEEQLDLPVFFKKLAQDYGIVPNSPQEHLDLIALGGSLQQAYVTEQTKQAAAQPNGQSRFSSFADEVSGVTGQADLANEHIVKQAAAEAAQNPLFASCVLTLQAARQRQLAAR